jgi:hypothetical protein
MFFKLEDLTTTSHERRDVGLGGLGVRGIVEVAKRLGGDGSDRNTWDLRRKLQSRSFK